MSWQFRILRTCWLSKTFADCNPNWAVLGWKYCPLWLGTWENFTYFRRTLEVSNTSGNSDLAWLKFRAYKYCNKCHGSFFSLFRWWFTICVLFHNTRILFSNDGLKNGVLKFKRSLNAQSTETFQSNSIHSCSIILFLYYSWKGIETVYRVGCLCEKIRIAKLPKILATFPNNLL